MMLDAMHWCQKQFNRAYNYVWTSSPWFYTWEIKHKLGAAYIKWLMQHNGIPIQNDSNPIWPYVLGELSQQAMQEGVARRDLYIFDQSFNLFGLNIPLKLRGFTFMSVVGDKKMRQKFCDAPARAAFDTPAGLVQLPNFVNVPWDEAAKKEKTLLKSFLAKNQDRLWWATRDYCQDLEKYWNPKHTAAQNLTLMTLRLIAQASFGIEDLPDEMYKLVEEFEDIWQHPEYFSASRFNQNISDFRAVTQHLQFEKKSKGPELQTDFRKDFYTFHKDRTFLKGPEELNIASFLAIFGNLPKAIIGMVFMVLADPEQLKSIRAEKERLEAKLDELGIDINSNKAFEYILSHSEVFQRRFYEVLRLWFIAPVIPRLNMNMWANKIGPWGDDMAIDADTYLPPRSLAICPQRLMALDEKAWQNPEQFNPERDEYQFKYNDKGRLSSVGQKPLVFGEEGSKRVCPGREVSRKIFYAVMWNLTDHYDFTLTDKEQLELNKPQDPFLHHMPLEPETNIPVKGILTRYQQEQASSSDEDDMPLGIVPEHLESQNSHLRY